MKLNWGYALTLVFIAFGGMIGYLVYRCSNTSFDLVSKEYYKDELEYQRTIDGMKNANALSRQTSVVLQAGDITIRFPEEMRHTNVTGDAWFYCTANAAKDKRIALSPDDGAVQQISRRQLAPGRYIVKLNWSSNNRHYYTEQPIVIQ